MRIKSNERDFDYLVGELLGVFYVLNILNMLIKNVYPESFLAKYATVVLGVTFGGILIYKISKVRFSYQLFITMEILTVILITLAIIIYPQCLSEILKRSVWMIAFCVPFLCFSLEVRKTECLFEALEPYMFGVVVLSVVHIILILKLGLLEASGGYNMSLGYTLLIPLMYHSIRFIKQKLYLILMVIELLIIVRYSSRGPLLCYVVFVALCILCIGSMRQRVKILMILGITTLGGVVKLILYDGKSAQNSISLVGANSRTISMISNGDMFKDSGRFIIWNRAIEAIKLKPLTGWGLCGDIPAIGEYPHLLFLEIILDFGIVIGGAFCIYVFWRIILLFNSNDRKDPLALMMFIVGIVSLCLSHSFIQTVEFWIFLGLGYRTRERWNCN